MSSPIQKLFREHGDTYIKQHGAELTEQHRKVISVIRTCGTVNAGTLVFRCTDCGREHTLARSCGNRMCPVCQTGKTAQWLDKQLDRQLPVHYFLLTFTVPEQLKPSILHSPKIAYNALFSAASKAIKTLALDPRHIGVDLPGFMGVLHTWGGTLQFHPHIHFVVPGGGIDKKSGLWRNSRVDFYLPVHALSKIFRAKFRHEMIERKLFDAIDPVVWSKNWNVNSQAVGENRQGVLKYLARYVFKTAITDSRILSTAKAKVTFSYRKKGAHRDRRMTLSHDEFMRRYLLHVLPAGFMRIRYYGFMSPGAGIDQQRLVALVELARAFDIESIQHQPRPETLMLCICCGGLLEFDRCLEYGEPLPEYASAPCFHRRE